MAFGVHCFENPCVCGRLCEEQKRKDKLVEEGGICIEPPHPWILEYEELVFKYETESDPYDETDYDEVVYDRFLEKHGEQWLKIWEDEKHRQLLERFYRISVIVCTTECLVTEEQWKIMRQEKVTSLELFTKKSPLYEKFHKEWNRALRMDFFKSTRERNMLNKTINNAKVFLFEQ